MSKTNQNTELRTPDAESNNGTENTKQRNQAEKKDWISGRNVDIGRQHRRGAVAFLGLGIIALLGAFLFPDLRSVLVALSGTGLFGAVLIQYLTLERFDSTKTSKAVYQTHATTGEEIVTEFGLQDDRVYIPVDNDEEGSAQVRLFIPSHVEFEIPDTDKSMPFLIDSGNELQRGVTLPPTGVDLYRDFRNMNSTVGEHPTPLVEHICDALVHQYEIVDEASVKTESERVQMSVSGDSYGSVDQFDHPVVSFLAVSLVATLDAPVTVDVTSNERVDYVVTCEWDERKADPR